MNNFQEEIDKFKKEIELKQNELAKLEKLYLAYPDLVKNVNRWKTVKYCSKSVNPIAVDYELKHNCGCCSDSPLEIHPYVNTEFGRIYSDPTGMFIGEDSYCGDRERLGWKDDLRKYNISETLINKVKLHFKDMEIEDE